MGAAGTFGLFLMLGWPATSAYADTTGPSVPPVIDLPWSVPAPAHQPAAVLDLPWNQPAPPAPTQPKAPAVTAPVAVPLRRDDNTPQAVDGEGKTSRMIRSLTPSGNTIADQAVRRALTALGTPYSWGGGDPKGPSYGVKYGADTFGYDCSGLVDASYGQVGYHFARRDNAQMLKDLTAPLGSNPANYQAGDLLFFGADTHHVGLFLGKYRGRYYMVDAPHTGAEVRVETFTNWPDFAGAGRLPDKSASQTSQPSVAIPWSSDAPATVTPPAPSAPVVTAPSTAAPATVPAVPTQSGPPDTTATVSPAPPATTDPSSVSGTTAVPFAVPTTPAAVQVTGNCAQYVGIMTDEANQVGVEPAVGLGVMSRETNCTDELQHGGGNGVGPMQVDTGYHPDAYPGMPADDNIRMGLQILSGDIHAMGDVQNGVAAYNEGVNGARQSLATTGDVDSGTTGGNYSADVMQRAEQFRQEGVQ